MILSTAIATVMVQAAVAQQILTDTLRPRPTATIEKITTDTLATAQPTTATSAETAGLKVPDNDDVLFRTIDSSSPYYYPALMMRYQAGDKTLTLDDYHYLYYGYIFTDSYKPLVPIEAQDRITDIFARNSEPDSTAMRKIIGYAEQVMLSDPFSPKNLNYLVYAYGSLGDTLNERRYYDMMTKVLATIERSGTGEKESSPMHVLWFSHAADWVTYKGLTIKNRQIVSIGKEFVFLTSKYKGKQGFYFDFSRVYMENPEQQPKRERKWQFNNLPVK